MADHERRAREHVTAGEAALNRFSLFGMGREQKVRDAVDCFVSAANAYKLGKLWAEAGDVFTRVADLRREINEQYEAGQALVEAANAYRNVNTMGAKQALAGAVAIFADSGKFTQAARQQKELAELCEQEAATGGGDDGGGAAAAEAEALEAYQTAADFYAMQGSHKQQQNACLLKVAHLAAQTGEYDRAAEIFENVGRENLENRLLVFNAKGYFLKALLCLMALEDMVAARQKLESFKNADYSLPDSRECQFVTNIIEAVDQRNTEDFATHCAEYDNIKRFDPWTTSVLLKIRQHIEGDLAGGEDEPDIT